MTRAAKLVVALHRQRHAQRTPVDWDKVVAQLVADVRRDKYRMDIRDPKAELHRRAAKLVAKRPRANRERERQRFEKALDFFFTVEDLSSLTGTGYRSFRSPRFA